MTSSLSAEIESNKFRCGLLAIFVPVAFLDDLAGRMPIDLEVWIYEVVKNRAGLWGSQRQVAAGTEGDAVCRVASEVTSDVLWIFICFGDIHRYPTLAGHMELCPAVITAGLVLADQ